MQKKPETQRKTLTKKDVEKYLKNPGRCPYCGSTHIGVTDQIEADGSVGTQEVVCNTAGCERSWLDVYTLTGIQEQ